MQKMVKIALLMGLMAAGQLEAMQPKYRLHSYLLLQASDQGQAKEYPIPYKSGLLFDNDSAQPVILPMESKDMAQFVLRLERDLEVIRHCYPVSIVAMYDHRGIPEYESFQAISISKHNLSQEDRVGRGKGVMSRRNPALSQGLIDENDLLHRAPQFIGALNAVTGPLPMPELKGFYGYCVAEILTNNRIVSNLLVHGRQKIEGVIDQLSDQSATIVGKYTEEINSPQSGPVMALLAGRSDRRKTSETKKRDAEFGARIHTMLDKLNENVESQRVVQREKNRQLLNGVATLATAGAGVLVIKQLLKR